jgi:hypothetical protein
MPESSYKIGVYTLTIKQLYWYKGLKMGGKSKKMFLVSSKKSFKFAMENSEK